MKIVYAGWKHTDKFNLTIRELKYQGLAPKTPLEVDDTLGRQIVKKYGDVYTLEDYEKKFGPLTQPEGKKEKKTQKDKMLVEVQEDKSEDKQTKVSK